MLVKVQKWGNSLALRIPKSFAKEVQLKAGAVVNLSLENGSLIIEPVKEQTEYELDELLSNVNETNIHKEYSYGKAQGKEIW